MVTVAYRKRALAHSQNTSPALPQYRLAGIHVFLVPEPYDRNHLPFYNTQNNEDVKLTWTQHKSNKNDLTEREMKAVSVKIIIAGRNKLMRAVSYWSKLIIEKPIYELVYGKYGDGYFQ